MHVGRTFFFSQILTIKSPIFRTSIIRENIHVIIIKPTLLELVAKLQNLIKES